MTPPVEELKIARETLRKLERHVADWEPVEKAQREGAPYMYGALQRCPGGISGIEFAKSEITRLGRFLEENGYPRPPRGGTPRPRPSEPVFSAQVIDFGQWRKPEAVS